MRQTPGDLFHFYENWGEQLHQTGRKNDMKYRNQSSELMKAKVLLSKDLQEGMPETQKALTAQDQHKRGKRKATEDKQKERKRIKTERVEKVMEDES